MLFSANAYSASKTVLVLGDSLSAEYGLARGTGWVPLLQTRLTAEKINASVVNASISGETSSGGKARLQSLLDNFEPQVVIIELGANDGLRGLPFTSMEDNLRTMIKASRKSGAHVVLVGMQLPPNYGNDYTQRFSLVFAKLAKEFKLAFIPFLLEGVVTRPELFQSDRLHPTAAAQSVILDNLWPILKPLLKN